MRRGAPRDAPRRAYTPRPRARAIALMTSRSISSPEPPLRFLLGGLDEVEARFDPLALREEVDDACGVLADALKDTDRRHQVGPSARHARAPSASLPAAEAQPAHAKLGRDRLRELGTCWPTDDGLGDKPGRRSEQLPLGAALERREEEPWLLPNGGLGVRATLPHVGERPDDRGPRRMKSFLRTVNSSSTRRRSASWIRLAVLLMAFTTALASRR